MQHYSRAEREARRHKLCKCVFPARPLDRVPSIAFRDTDSSVIVSRWPQLRERGVARGFDFMKTYSRARSRHPRAGARVRPLATIRQRAPTFIVRGARRFLIVGGGGTVRVIDSFDPGLRPDLP